MGIDISLHAPSLDDEGAGAEARFQAFLSATRDLADECPERDAAIHALAMKDAGKGGYLRSRRGEDGLFGTLDAALGIDSMVFLFPVGEEPERLDVKELSSKVAFLESAARRLDVGTEPPIFDEVLEQLVDSDEPWAEAEAKWIVARRRGELGVIARIAKKLGRKPPTRALDAAGLARIGRILETIRAFADLAASLEARGEAPSISISQ